MITLLSLTQVNEHTAPNDSILTGPGAHPASVQWVQGLFPPSQKWSGHGVDKTPPLSVEDTGRVVLWAFMACGSVTFTFLLCD